MKYLSLLVIIALAAAAALLPSPDAPVPAAPPAAEETPVAVCAIEEGSGRTSELSVLSTVDGPVALTLFASGDTAGSITHTTGASGSVVIPIVDVAAVGTVGGLVEMPTAESAAGVRVVGADSLSDEACAASPDAESFLTGATTAGGRTFSLHMMNPYAGEAIVELTVQSEAGIESNARFESVIVPPRSSTIRDFTELVPGRETLSVTIETTKGRVVAVGRQGVAGESAVWRAVPAQQDWFIPVPRSPGLRNIVIGTPQAADVEYQVDVYRSGGLDEALITGTIESRGQVVVGLEEFGEEPIGVRVVSTGPVVPTLWMESEAGLGVTTASAVPANRWLLPGAGAPIDGWATVVIMNVGIEASVVSIRPLRQQTELRNIALEADSVLELAIEQADGYLVESVGEAVVLWSSHRDSASSAAIGVPLFDE